MNIEDAFEAAIQARTNAYAPYSGYKVGCALLGEDERIYIGCNVENVSYGATLCAERVAVGNMVSSGCERFVEAVVATGDGAAPCGICLQVLLEFASENGAMIHCIAEDGTVNSFALTELLPYGFGTGQAHAVHRDS